MLSDVDTQKFMDLIFDEDMFKGAMASFDIDVKKMPLGNQSKTQVAKGFERLCRHQNSLPVPCAAQDRKSGRCSIGQHRR